MEWNEVNNRLEKTFIFKQFEDAMSFMQALVPQIAEINHHPTWQNTYNQIRVQLQTHDAGNTVTAKDRELADIMDKEYANYT
jgi:4a-hydroxytetrahydrobiopterin dehydratase